MDLVFSTVALVEFGVFDKTFGRFWEASVFWKLDLAFPIASLTARLTADLDDTALTEGWHGKVDNRDGKCGTGLAWGAAEGTDILKEGITCDILPEGWDWGGWGPT